MSRDPITITLANSSRPHSYYPSVDGKRGISYELPENISLYSNFPSKQFSFNYYGSPNVGGTITLTAADGKQKQIVVQPFSGLIDIR